MITFSVKGRSENLKFSTPQKEKSVKLNKSDRVHLISYTKSDICTKTFSSIFVSFYASMKAINDKQRNRKQTEELTLSLVD